MNETFNENVVDWNNTKHKNNKTKLIIPVGNKCIWWKFWKKDIKQPTIIEINDKDYNLNSEDDTQKSECNHKLTNFDGCKYFCDCGKNYYRIR